MVIARPGGRRVWDNFESVHSMPDPARATPPLDAAQRDAVRSFLAEIGRDSRSAVIITSRSPEPWLGEIARTEVGRLLREDELEYAEHLLAASPEAQARRVGREFEQLLDTLGGHPLSMRLILPHLQRTSAASLVAALRGDGDLPGGSADARGRLDSLTRCVEYSFRHLTDEHRRRAVAVALFEGVADVDVLAAFSKMDAVPARFRGVSKKAWEKTLDECARLGLLSPLGGGMYGIHPALPGYLTELWRDANPAFEEERQTVRAAFLTSYAVLGQWLDKSIGSGGGAGTAMAVMHLQRRTMGRLLGEALESRRYGEAQALIEPLSAYFEARGLRDEESGWLDRCRIATEGAAGEIPDLDTDAGALWLFAAGEEGNNRLDAGDLETAEATYDRIRQILEQSSAQSAKPRHATTNHQVGMVAHRRARLDDAERWYWKSLAINEELVDRPGMASSYHQLGMVAQDRGRLDDAERWYSKSLAIKEELDDPAGIASSYHQLGTVALGRARLDDAERWYWKSLAIKEELLDRPGMASSYHQLGILAQDRGRLDDAERWYSKSLAIKEELDDPAGIASSYHQLGTVALDRGRLDDAERWYSKSLAIEEELGNRLGIASSYDQRGMVAQLSGRLEDAERLYSKSLAIKEKIGNRPRMASSYHRQGMVAQLSGRFEDAERWYSKSLAIAEELGNRPAMAMSHGQMGLLVEAQGKKLEALDWTVRCVALFPEFPHPATGPGPEHLARLTRELGLDALEDSWRRCTGHTLPDHIRTAVKTSL